MKTAVADPAKADPDHPVRDPVPIGDGHVLDSQTRAILQPRFGFDFSRVRIHTDDQADRSARNLGAAAYTTGEHIMFRRPAYDAQTPAGLELIAHELAHVVQRSRGRAAESDAASEEAADRAAHLAIRGGSGPIQVAGALGDSPACQPEQRRSRRLSQVEMELPRSVHYLLDPGRLDREYRAALAQARRDGDWRLAAEKLNGFNHEDIQRRLAELTTEEVGYLHLGARARVGHNAQLTRLTDPSMPRASTAPPRVSVSPKPKRRAGGTALAAAVVRSMSNTDKLVAAYERAPIAAATRRQIESLVSPESLVLALLTFAGVWLVSQLTPAGWAADVGIAITGIFLGSVIFDAIKHLLGFAKAVDANTEADLQLAGNHFAEAVAKIGIQSLLMLVIRGSRGGPKGSTSYQGPTPRGYADVVTADGFVIRIPTRGISITSSKTISPALAAQLGFEAVPATHAFMQAAGGPAGPSGGGKGPTSAGGGSPSSGGTSPAHAPQAAKPKVTGGANPTTAGTGGIASIDRLVEPKTGVARTTIEGRVQHTLSMRAKLEKILLPPWPGVDRAHLWGRIFGDEAAAGVLYAPPGFNRGVQLRLEKAIRQLQQEAAASGAEVWLKAVNRSYPRDVAGGKALAEVSYEFSVRLPNGTTSRNIRIDFTVDKPGTAVTPNRPGYTVSSPYEGGGTP